MKANQTFGIDFITRLCKSDRTSALLFARITVDGERKEISLKEAIKIKDWDSAREIMKGQSIGAKTINCHIDDVRFRIKEKYRLLKDLELLITAESIKEAYLGIHITQKSKHSLCELMKYHTKIEGEKLKGGTMKNYVATEEYIKKFLKAKFSVDDIALGKLNREFIIELEYYIRNNPLKAHDPCLGNGVMKHLERFKKMVAWAKVLQWITVDPYDNYQLNLKRYKRPKLTIEELMTIEAKEFNTSTLLYIKDLFLFSCYTGLAYADVMALSRDNFEIDHDGQLWCKIYRQKSEELSSVPVLNVAAMLMEKYKNNPKSLNTGKVFPYVSNQDVNRNLKIIGEVCGIEKYMSFHLGRHTFATAVTLKNGVPIETVSKMLGHKKITTTQIYAEVDEAKIASDMSDIGGLLNKIKSKYQVPFRR
jgi:site-specific recombinase XerD